MELGERTDLALGFDLTRVMNSGVAFGLFSSGSEAAVLAFTGGALALIVGWFAFDATRPWLWLGVGLLSGGAIGNLIDRISDGAVTDFLDPPLWPAFNVADIAITAGVLVIAISALTAPAEQPAEP
jgi:signal peptidase II